jgi:serine/threonine-protein kinase
MIEIGDKIDGRYRIVSRVGSGGMAEVYEATDIFSKKIVAIKIMKEDLLKNPENLKRFKYELISSASLNHPNIVKVYNQGEVDGRPYIANEFIKGQTLKEKLDFSTSLSVHESCEIMLQLCSAVNYIHQHGVIHRDIKPQNIYYMSDGTVKLGDFGIAINEQDFSDSNSNSIMGSVHYLAPELCQSGHATVQSDIYALGVTFFELITGRLPYEDGEAIDIAVQHVKKPFPSPTKFNPNLSKEIEHIIMKACKKDPKERYESAFLMAQDIDNAMKNKDNFHERKGFFSKLFGFKN